MGKDKPENPRAFASNTDYGRQEGMTLRDYFAAKVTQGICSHNDTWGLQLVEIAKKAYELADAMLKAREIKP
jgi:hypothetical protein